MSHTTLRPDCARCAALCCVAFRFERSPRFALEKEAGEPCANLDGKGRCAIHGRRGESGFGGCVDYDCHGAGQWVTQELFGGRSWIEDRAILPAMTEAFLTVERGRRLLLLLREAGKLDLSADHRRRLGALEAALEAAMTDEARIVALEAEVGHFLHGLRRYVERASL